MSPERQTRRMTLSAAVLAGLAMALPASAAAGDFDELRVNLRAGKSPAFVRDVRSNCGHFYAGGIRLRKAATVRGAEAGTLDFLARRGEARALAAEWQIGRSQGVWVRFSDLGVRIDGRRVFVTAIVSRTRGVPRGGRKRIATIRGARIESGLMDDVPSTNRTRVAGRLALLAPMARAIRRMPCRGRARRRIGPGYVAGTVGFEYRAERASGLEGAAELLVESATEGVSVQPTGGAQPGGEGFTAPIASGLPVPLVCFIGRDCYPSGAYTLGGGFDLVRGTARASVTDLVVRGSGTTVQDVVHTISASLNGSPVTIVDEAAPDGPAGWSEDFTRRVSAILGVEASGRLGVLARFTRTGPVP
jgi:hypothetical protein